MIPFKHFQVTTQSVSKLWRTWVCQTSLQQSNSCWDAQSVEMFFPWRGGSSLRPLSRSQVGGVATWSAIRGGSEFRHPLETHVQVIGHGNDAWTALFTETYCNSNLRRYPWPWLFVRQVLPFSQTESLSKPQDLRKVKGVESDLALRRYPLELLIDRCTAEAKMSSLRF